MTGLAMLTIVLQNCRMAGLQDCPALQFAARLRGFSEEDFALFVLQQKRVRDTQLREEPDDVAIDEAGLPAMMRRVGPVLQRDVIDDDELGVRSVDGLRRPEE